ncbi:GCD14 [Coprinopsis cinerea okayama7|uniref:tRNA (adenine(58)-N(1))-methyltransferase catalytic subunit TRM61 n=1 Tax=Coprinopsis cinerea (strain Okayama-7 / 130 / ATCC MYA-4618 / FGSC 9003) TaxID=240176 RepID=A8NQG5_COPC7|nr:GCD14 [Coprinopsis cinerea okayama7\|eukprot:XP_001835552.1 GCD14 [Coprinopsis cinerea okayama7\
MWSTAREIAAGDLVIVWMTRELIIPLTVTPGATLHNKFGVYPHDALIGVPYGSKIRSQTGKGFMHVLRPTPELWTLALPHRTQILYLADISFITDWLGIRPGSRVIEAGTGSASFSHSVARTIGPTGKLYSFEFHEQRAAKAREEFGRHGMTPFVTLQHRNVCKDGFGDVVDEADAVFLDLPAPWDAIPHAKKALRKDHTARICCFSPCIEQVLRTVAALNDAGFTEITTYETLLRPIDVQTAPAFPSLDDVTERLKQAEVKREEKRQRQIKANREKEAKDKQKSATEGESTATGKRKHDEVVATDGAQQVDTPEVSELEPKRLKTEGEVVAEEMQMDSTTAGPSSSTTPDAARVTTPSSKRTPVVLSKSGTPISFASATAVSKALPEVRGHTSYLTFACLAPYERYKPAETGTPTPSSSNATPAPIPAATPVSEPAIQNANGAEPSSSG